MVPPPGSSSTVYAPNPGALVVAIDPGHGGCLDWGVPNPYDNKVDKSEKADTLGIGLALKSLLEAQGVTVVMTRTDDSALAGDDYAPLGCHGAPWRDVNGDGITGFGPKVPEATRTRDELSARIDLANVARADIFIAIHINSMTDNGVLYRIAASQTYYTDAFAWAATSKRLAQAVQDGAVRSLAGATNYKRQDRGIDGTAPYLYELKPAGTDPKSPRRPLLMPAILSEVGSVSLQAESELLATNAGRQAAARGVFDGVAAYFAQRPLAARLDAVLPGGAAGLQPEAVSGSGPPFWPPVLPDATHLSVRMINTGSAAWPAGVRLAAGWGATTAPYLAAAPADLAPLEVTVPALAPGASVELGLTLPAPPSGRQVAWITLLAANGAPLTEAGSPALQVATRGP
ncbi:MAG: N-acetylmuramoyl-L-alanine amidase [Chloroflexota bacterium]|nr:N-acetylmuramoyl-L-alanine amidase [Chloroflexota bacterium]